MVMLLVGCNRVNSIEDVFHKEMKSHKDVDDYNLIKEKDNIILFTYEQNNLALKIAYFSKVNNEWVWDKTASCDGK